MFLVNWAARAVKPLVSRSPRLAAIYRGMRDQWDMTGDPQPTPWGFTLAGHPGMSQGAFEPTETELVRKLLQDVEVLVNVGANVGYYCCHALSMGKSVVAFEPMPRNLHYLCMNLNANGEDRAEIFPLALSNKPGLLEIYGGGTGASVVKGWAGTPESYKTIVPCSTMDITLGARLTGKRALVLVDIEGAEKWMLEGAEKMLANDPRPIWMVEIMATIHQPAGVEFNPNWLSTFQMFFDRGYTAYGADAEMRPVSVDDVRRMALGQMPVINHNFLFM